MSAGNPSSSDSSSRNPGVRISKEQFDQVQYLLEQSERGNHILFDRQTLLEALAAEDGAPIEAGGVVADREVESHIQNLLTTPSLRGKKLYIERLDRATRSRVVRVYFGIIENSLFERPEARH